MIRTFPILPLLAALCGGCGPEPAAPAGLGDARRGATALRQYACISCHSIPGQVAADNRLAPPLDGFAARTYIAGRLANTPDNLVRWIVDPKAVDRDTAMPDLDVPPAVARDMAAYLYGET